MATLEPLAVSPFIKFCRWTLLGAGIFYGYSRYHYLSKVQKSRREVWEKQRPAREAKAKAEKEAALAAEYANLASEFGTKFP